MKVYENNGNSKEVKLLSPSEVDPPIKDEYLDKIEGVYITCEKINEREGELARKIAQNYKEDIHVRFVLTGAWDFCSDMCQRPELPPIKRIDWMNSDGYGQRGTKAGKERDIEIHKPNTVEGDDILIFEDILDTRRTAKKIIKKLEKLGARSIGIVSLLDKPDGKKVELDPDVDVYTGFEIPDYFVVGKGLDCKEMGRDIPHICVWKEE